MVRLATLALCVLAACGGDPPRPGIPPRHALLITVEGLRADRCSAYLHHRDTTTFHVDEPMRVAGRALTLDELAHAGTLFTQAFAPTGHPVDSLLAAHTGRAARIDAPPGEAIDLAGATTLAAEFHRAGAETAAFVAGTFAARSTGALRAGFQTFSTSDTNGSTIEAALDYLAQRDWGSGGHTFLWLHLATPVQAAEVVAPAGLEALTRSFVDAAYEGERDPGALRARVAAGETLAEAEHAYLVDHYDSALSHTNALLFHFLDQYRIVGDPGGGWDSTVTVLAGTHGVELGARAGTPSWSSLHDSGLRVPLLLRHPDSLTGRRIFAELVSLSDVAPTLAEWFDLEGEFGGRSLLAITDSYIEKGFAAAPILTTSRPSRLSLRTRDWRLTVDSTGGSPPALFRIERMREIEEDVAGAYPEVVTELMATMHELAQPADAEED